jgi:hypothetical protein
MDTEIWKTISGFEIYKVSNLGRIKNSKTNLILSNIEEGGYLRVTLRGLTKKRNNFLVHRLVAQTFIPNLENKPTVNHKNKDKTNNKVENLEWSTMKEQAEHKKSDGKKYGVENGIRKRAIWRCDPTNFRKIEKYDSFSNAAQYLIDNKITESKKHIVISLLCRYFAEKQYEKFGFSWEYDEEEYEDEVWKEIPKEHLNNLEKYEISSYGKLKSPAGRIRSGRTNDVGYIEFYLKGHLYKAHRLVALVFLENPENKHQVNHKDKNKSNNHISNLEWVRASDNIKHRSVLSGCKKVIQYSDTIIFIAEYKSIAEASRVLKISAPCISNCCNGKIEETKGMKFKFSCEIIDDSLIEHISKEK